MEVFFYSYVDPIHSWHLTWQLKKKDLDLCTLVFSWFLCPIFYDSCDVIKHNSSRHTDTVNDLLPIPFCNVRNNTHQHKYESSISQPPKDWHHCPNGSRKRHHLLALNIDNDHTIALDKISKFHPAMLLMSVSLTSYLHKMKSVQQMKVCSQSMRQPGVWLELHHLQKPAKNFCANAGPSRNVFKVDARKEISISWFSVHVSSSKRIALVVSRKFQ
jgi:hypothetical protein